MGANKRVNTGKVQKEVSNRRKRTRLSMYVGGLGKKEAFVYLSVCCPREEIWARRLSCTTTVRENKKRQRQSRKRQTNEHRTQIRFTFV